MKLVLVKVGLGKEDAVACGKGANCADGHKLGHRCQGLVEVYAGLLGCLAAEGVPYDGPGGG